MGQGILSTVAPVPADPARPTVEVLVGKESFLTARHGTRLSDEHVARRLALEHDGHTVVLVAVNGVPAAMVALTNKVSVLRAHGPLRRP